MECNSSNNRSTFLVLGVQQGVQNLVLHSREVTKVNKVHSRLQEPICAYVSPVAVDQYGEQAGTSHRVNIAIMLVYVTIV